MSRYCNLLTARVKTIGELCHRGGISAKKSGKKRLFPTGEKTGAEKYYDFSRKNINSGPGEKCGVEKKYHFRRKNIVSATGENTRVGKI